jgi:hypothetical protein
MPKELVRKRGKRKPKSDPAPASVAASVAPVASTSAAALALAPTDGRDAGYGQRAARHAAQEKAAYGAPATEGEEGAAEPSWVTPADGGLGSIRERVEGDAPWGFVDPEVRLVGAPSSFRLPQLAPYPPG